MNGDNWGRVCRNVVSNRCHTSLFRHHDLIMRWKEEKNGCYQTFYFLYDWIGRVRGRTTLFRRPQNTYSFIQIDWIKSRMETRDKNEIIIFAWLKPFCCVCVYIDLINNVDHSILLFCHGLVDDHWLVQSLSIHNSPPGHIEKVTLHSRVVFRKPMTTYDPLSHDFFHAMSSPATGLAQ